jgi:hypothetical protein
MRFATVDNCNPEVKINVAIVRNLALVDYVVDVYEHVRVSVPVNFIHIRPLVDLNIEKTETVVN